MDRKERCFWLYLFPVFDLLDLYLASIFMVSVLLYYLLLLQTKSKFMEKTNRKSLVVLLYKVRHWSYLYFADRFLILVFLQKSTFLLVKLIVVRSRANDSVPDHNSISFGNVDSAFLSEKEKSIKCRRWFANAKSDAWRANYWTGSKLAGIGS